MKQVNIPDSWLGILGLSFLGVLYFLFTEVSQSEFTQLMIGVSVLFGVYSLFVFRPLSQRGVQIGIGIAIAARVMTLLCFPNLSDDIYRFIWDGMCWHDGLNPFELTPSQLMDTEGLSQYYLDLYPLLNSQEYFTIYPPICQVVFWLASISPQVIEPNVIFKVVFLLSEAITLLVLIRLCDLLNIDKGRVLIYALNPLIILELCGNLHFEALMLMFLAVMYYLLKQNRLQLAGLSYGLAISTKLVPLVFGPILLCYLGIKRGFRFFIPAALVTIGSFALMLQGHFSSILSSTNLYFQKFEFNASVYYLLRELGILLTTYNQIRILGPGLALIAFSLIVYYSAKKEHYTNYRSLLASSALIFACYLLLSTTIHPWYLSTLVLLCVLSRYRFPILWSYLVFLSYSAYQFQPTDEVAICLIAEYGIVGIYAWYEVFYKPKQYGVSISK